MTPPQGRRKVSWGVASSHRGNSTSWRTLRSSLTMFEWKSGSCRWENQRDFVLHNSLHRKEIQLPQLILSISREAASAHLPKRLRWGEVMCHDPWSVNIITSLASQGSQWWISEQVPGIFNTFSLSHFLTPIIFSRGKLEPWVIPRWIEWTNNSLLQRDPDIV